MPGDESDGIGTVCDKVAGVLWTFVVLLGLGRTKLGLVNLVLLVLAGAFFHRQGKLF